MVNVKVEIQITVSKITFTQFKFKAFITQIAFSIKRITIKKVLLALFA